MKVTVITAVFNNRSHIEDCIRSVLNQTYKNIEYVVIDGGSTDGTVDIINKYDSRISRWISEPDKGLYDAMNKGINLASGDVIGILNSDDLYFDEHVIETVVGHLRSSDSCYGDLLFVDRANTDRVVRYWKSKKYNKMNFKKGWMPPHPTFFVRTDAYRKYGTFDTDLAIAADYELMLRFLFKHDLTASYVPKVLVRMRVGGKSKPGICNTAKALFENYRAWRINKLKFYPAVFVLKPLSKLFQYTNTNHQGPTDY